MVAAISAINSYSDSEYLRVLQELKKLGISPSGNPAIDKSKLQQAKNELIQKIQDRNNSAQNQNIPEFIPPLLEVEDPKRNEMEIQRLGAMTIAELNRLYFGI